jgi:hypothetical protein
LQALQLIMNPEHFVAGVGRKSSVKLKTEEQTEM